MTKANTVRILIKIIGSLFLGLVFFVAYMMYLPKEEKKFLDRINAEFKSNSATISSYEKKIKISNIFDFDWEKVCLINSEIYFPFLGKEELANEDFLGKNYRESPLKNIDTSNPKFRSGFVFQLYGKPEKIFKFSKFDHIKVDGASYDLGYIDWSKKEYFSTVEPDVAIPCFSRKYAILKINNHSNIVLLGAE